MKERNESHLAPACGSLEPYWSSGHLGYLMPIFSAIGWTLTFGGRNGSFGFWIAQQGAIIGFVLILIIYAM